MKIYKIIVRETYLVVNEMWQWQRMNELETYVELLYQKNNILARVLLVCVGFLVIFCYLCYL